MERLVRRGAMENETERGRRTSEGTERRETQLKGVVLSGWKDVKAKLPHHSLYHICVRVCV